MTAPQSTPELSSEQIATPRTDAAILDWSATKDDFVDADFARQLERELAEAALIREDDCAAIRIWHEKYQEAQAELSAMKQERDMFESADKPTAAPLAHPRR